MNDRIGKNSTKRKKICIIHSRQAAREVLARALYYKLRADVAHFPSCEHVPESCSDYDVFIVYNSFQDDTNAIQGVRKIRSAKPDAFIIGVSSIPHFDKRFLLAGADTFLLRNGNEIEELVKNINRQTTDGSVTGTTGESDDRPKAQLRICLIHRRPPAREVLTRALGAKLHASVTPFSCCENALASSLDYDVFIVYNNFRKKMNGVRCVAEIRAQKPDALIIGVSSIPNFHTKFLPAGADAFLLKAGNEVEELANIVHRRVQRGVVTKPK
jgi:PleD family two-component response regulator